MKFTLTIETESAKYALAPRQLIKVFKQLVHDFRSRFDEAVSIHGYEGRVHDSDGNTIGKWSWTSGAKEKVDDDS